MEDKFPPDFNLAKLDSFPIAALSGKNGPEDHHSFVLAVSTAFNDLKDYYWVYQQLIDNRPSDLNKIDPRRGQWNGMGVFVVRKILATFYEFLELLEKKSQILEHQTIKNAVALMGPTSRAAWNRLTTMAIAKAKGLPNDQQSIYKVVMRVRHNITSHYYGTDNFSSGFKAYCQSRHDAAVYASMGETMEGTRFFYADAACQQFLQKIHSDHSVTQEQVLKSVKEMNEACRMFLESFLDVSSGRDKLLKAKKRKSVPTQKPKPNPKFRRSRK
ncbi:MAG: hypothetical protein KF865_02330 [Bdellovibrionaceae bacterium]|nr:hypothetical protein [Pseudobdellovibrionaceae bacterium]